MCLTEVVVPGAIELARGGFAAIDAKAQELQRQRVSPTVTPVTDDPPPTPTPTATPEKRVCPEPPATINYRKFNNHVLSRRTEAQILDIQGAFYAGYYFAGIGRTSEGLRAYYASTGPGYKYGQKATITYGLYFNRASQGWQNVNAMLNDFDPMVYDPPIVHQTASEFGEICSN